MNVSNMLSFVYQYASLKVFFIDLGIIMSHPVIILSLSLSPIGLLFYTLSISLGKVYMYELCWSCDQILILRAKYCYLLLIYAFEREKDKTISGYNKFLFELY